MHASMISRMIAICSLLILTFLDTSGQCGSTSFESLKKIVISKDAEDYLIEEGFDKYDPQVETITTAYGKCRKVISQKGDSTYTNYEETFLFNTGNTMSYLTYNRNSYLKCLEAVKRFRFIGYYDIPGFKITYYSDGKIFYGYTVISRNIFEKTAINLYKIDFSLSKPYINKTE